MTMTQTKLQDALTEFQTVRFTEYFKWWCDYWAHCRKYQEGYFTGNNVD